MKVYIIHAASFVSRLFLKLFLIFNPFPILPVNQNYRTMLLKALIGLSVVSTFVAATTPPEGEAIVKKMYDRYHGKWQHNYTFNQTTEIYHNDTLTKKQTWYEAIEFPNKFRIDFGPADSGNAVLFVNDSSFRFKGGKLTAARKDHDDLTFLLGGMYFFPFEEVKEKLKEQKYDLNKFHEETWQGKPVYVLGADKGEENVNQLWIDKANLYLVRMITFDNNRKEDARFEKQVRLNGGWSESTTLFYVNDQLIQAEYYHDLKSNIRLDPKIFDPRPFSKR